MSLSKRQLIESEVKRLQVLTGIALLTLALYAGVPKRTWREWQERREQETKHNGQIPRGHWLTPEEEAAIIKYCGERMGLSYRVLCYQMLDENIVAVAPGSVYNVLNRHGLNKETTQLNDDANKGFVQPTKIHEHWHTDFSYIKIGCAFYYFISIIDGYSRKILCWDLCESMEGINAELLLTRAKELYPDAKNPKLITDNGSQFCSKDFRELVILFEIEHAFIKPGHPQSNGKIERFHRSFKTEHVRVTAYLGYEDAKARMTFWLNYYNEKRLHGALNYLTPEDVFSGNADRRLAERREKLHTAFITRRSYWQNQTANTRTSL